jgi:hypothetical protein
VPHRSPNLWQHRWRVYWPPDRLHQNACCPRTGRSGSHSDVVLFRCRDVLPGSDVGKTYYANCVGILQVPALHAVALIEASDGFSSSHLLSKDGKSVPQDYIATLRWRPLVAGYHHT